MDALTMHISFGVSVVTALFTFYFWLIKARRERPCLKIYQADPQLGGFAQSSCTDPVKLVFEVKSVVANYSSLPNALLGVEAKVKMRDGSWQDAETRLDPKTPLPINIPAMQTMRLDVSLTIAVPAVPEGQACRNTQETFALYRNRFVAQPLEVNIGLVTLGEKLFAYVLTSAKRAA